MTITHPSALGLDVQVLGQIRDSLAEILIEQRATREKINDTQMRVVKLEEHKNEFVRIQSDIETLYSRVGVLLNDKASRDGERSVWSGILRNWQLIVTIIAPLALSALILTGRIKL